MTEHTPTPYNLTDPCRIEQSDFGLIASLRGDSFTAGSNGRFIVRACNNHYDLVKTLKQGSDIISGLEAACDQAGIGDLVEVRDWWRKADALLEKIGGQ